MVKRRSVRKSTARRSAASARSSRRSVGELDSGLAAGIALGLRTVELSAAARDGMRARILGRIADHPAPANTVTIRRGAMEWTPLNERVAVTVLRRDEAANNQTVLIRMLPGAEIVAHSHTQEEECLVMEGEIEVGGHRVFAGDMHIAQPGGSHATITSRTGALLLVRSEIPPAGFSMV